MYRDESKKTESLSVKTTKELKTVLTKIAREKKWTISQTAEEIIKTYLKEKGILG